MTPKEENILLAMEVERLKEALKAIQAVTKCYIPGAELSGARKEVWDITQTALSSTQPTKAQAMLKVANAAIGYINAKGYTNIKPKLEELQQAVKELEEV